MHNRFSPQTPPVSTLEITQSSKFFNSLNAKIIRAFSCVTDDEADGEEMVEMKEHDVQEGLFFH